MKDQAQDREQDNPADGEVRQAKARETAAAAFFAPILDVITYAAGSPFHARSVAIGGPKSRDHSVEYLGGFQSADALDDEQGRTGDCCHPYDDW